MHLVTLHDVPIGRLLVVAGHVVSQRWNRLLAEQFNLTQAGMVTLMTLDKHGALPHGEVAQRCFVRPATLTGIIDAYSYPGSHVVVIVYAADIVGGRPEAADECLEVRTFAPEDIPWDDLAFESTREALRDYVRRFFPRARPPR